MKIVLAGSLKSESADTLESLTKQRDKLKVQLEAINTKIASMKASPKGNKTSFIVGDKTYEGSDVQKAKTYGKRTKQDMYIVLNGKKSRVLTYREGTRAGTGFYVFSSSQAAANFRPLMEKLGFKL